MYPVNSSANADILRKERVADSSGQVRTGSKTKPSAFRNEERLMPFGVFILMSVLCVRIFVWHTNFYSCHDNQTGSNHPSNSFVAI